MERNPGKTFVHIVDYRKIFGKLDISDLPEFVEWSEESGNIRRAEKVLRKSKPDLRRGDLMYINGWDYRNDGVLIYDGEHFIQLETEIDDYGYLPEQFTTEEFPIDYWHGVEGTDHSGIEHNGIIWVPKHKISPPLRKFVDKEDVRIIFYYVELVTRGKTVMLCFCSIDGDINYDDFPELIPFNYLSDAPEELTQQYGEGNVYIATGEGFDYPY